jgi:hypothetical protein
MKGTVLTLTLVWLALVGCQKEAPGPTQPQADAQNAEIEAAVRTYLASQPNLALDNMEIEFKKISVEADTARADMVFRTKGGEGEMPMQYDLIREDGNWVVQRKNPSHGGPQMPPDHPPVQPQGTTNPH